MEKHLGLLDATLKPQREASINKHDSEERLSRLDPAWVDAHTCLQRLADQHVSVKKDDCEDSTLAAFKLLQGLQDRLQTALKKAADSREKRDEL